MLAFSEMVRALIDATNHTGIPEKDEIRMKKALIQGGKILTRVLKRVINPNDSATIADFDLVILFDQGVEDMKWFYKARQHRTESCLSPEDMKDLWQWMEKKETQKMMENKTSLLENLIEVLKELEQGEKKTRSKEVLFLMELFSIFWELLDSNKETTNREGYISVILT